MLRIETKKSILLVSQWTYSQNLSMGGVGGLGAESPALDDFCNFSIKITHFVHISAEIVVLRESNNSSINCV